MLLMYLNSIKTVDISIYVHNLDDCNHFTTNMMYFLKLHNNKKCCVKSFYFLLCRCYHKSFLYLCCTCRKTVIHVYIISLIIKIVVFFSSGFMLILHVLTKKFDLLPITENHPKSINRLVFKILLINCCLYLTDISITTLESLVLH